MRSAAGICRDIARPDALPLIFSAHSQYLGMIEVRGRDLGRCDGGEHYGFLFYVPGLKPVVSLVRTQSALAGPARRLFCDNWAFVAATGLECW